MNTDSLRSCARRSAALFLGLSCITLGSLAQQVPLRAQVPVLPAGAVDQGQLAPNTPVQVTLHLQPPADRINALKNYLVAVQTPGDPAFHQWLTPVQFGEQFGVTQAQVMRLKTWAKEEGVSSAPLSASRTSVTVSGTAAAIEAALAPALHSVVANGATYITNTVVPTLPATLHDDVIAVSGLSTVPSEHPTTIAAASGTDVSNDALSTLTSLVDANSTRLIAVSSTACAEQVDEGTQAATQLRLQQASLQGITVLAGGGCATQGSASFPSSLSEVTAVAIQPGLTAPVSAALSELRPVWQIAPGLPANGLRQAPDLTTSDLAALANTVKSILARVPAQADGTPGRLGNINATLYKLGPMPGLYTQPDKVAAGTWEATTGLGLVDLDNLAKFFPLGALSTDVSISLDNYFVTHGTNLTFTSVVKDISGQGNGAVPSGTITFNVTPGGALGPVALKNGTATLTTNALPGGTYSVTASYSGDANYAAKTSSVTDTFTIGPENATLTASQVASVPIGSSATLAVTVKSPSGVGTPTGKVNALPSGTPDTNTYTGTLSGANGTAVAQVLLPGVQAGSDVFLITCDGSDPSFACPTQRVTVNFLKATPAVTISASPSNPNSGDTVTFQATIAAAGNNAAAPTGNVNFLNNGAIVGAGTVSGGVATLTTNAYAWSASGNTFSANYGGDNNYNSNSSTTTTTSGTIGTTTVVSASPGVVPIGGQITVTATVSPNQTSANTIGGTVTFVAGSATVCTAAVSNGIATCTGSVTTVGVYGPIVANYAGDSHFAASTSGTQSVSVQVVKGTTATTIAATPANPSAGQSVTYTATVKNTNGSATAFPLSGVVTFYVNGAAVGAPTLTNGQATYTATLGSATTAVYAVYSGDGNWEASTSSTLNLNSAGTTTGSGSSATTLTASTTFTLTGSNVVFTATINQAAGGTNSSPLSGSVTFLDSYNGQSTPLGTFTVSSNGPGAGFASVSTTGLKRGTHVVTAVYSGNGSYSTSTSAAVTVNITDADVTFSPATVTVAAGSSASTTATVTAYSGFTGQVTLTCTPPAGTGITCSFNPATLNNAGTSTLTVITTAQHSALEEPQFGKAIGHIALAGLIVVFCLPNARKRRAALFVALLSVATFGALGCTNIINGGNGGKLAGGTPSGTQYLTITATVSDGKTNVSHSQQFQVTVQ